MHLPSLIYRFYGNPRALTLSTTAVASCRLLLATLALAVMISSHSCNESLPPYQEPQQLYNATIDGKYWLSDTEHSLTVYFRITNVFDETLEGPALLTGKIQISSARDTSIHKTFLLGTTNLFSGYVLIGKTLRIDPKQTMVLKATWDFIGDKVSDDKGRNLAGDSATASFFTYVEDKTCQWRRLARPEDLLLQGTVRLFERTAPLEAGPTVFPFCFVTNFVSVKLCPRIETVPPCSNWPSAVQ